MPASNASQTAVRIGIPVPTSADPAYNQVCWPQYAASIKRAGAEPVSLALDLSPEDLQAEASRLDGFVLPGSPADVAPTAYGAPPSEASAPPDPAREFCDRSLLAHAAATGKPVLAICFGLQILNVWRGGTLHQDLPPIPLNHAAGSQVAIAHSVLVEPESLLGALLTASEAPPEPLGPAPLRRLPVNSSHHQAVSLPGDDLTVVARSADDGTIEALEGRIGEAAMLGVQWHPERSTDLSAASRALFSWLVLEASDRKGSATIEGTLAAHR